MNDLTEPKLYADVVDSLSEITKHLKRTTPARAELMARWIQRIADLDSWVEHVFVVDSVRADAGLSRTNKDCLLELIDRRYCLVAWRNNGQKPTVFRD